MIQVLRSLIWRSHPKWRFLRPKLPAPDTVKQILVIRFSAYGDIAFCLPFLPVIRSAFPDAKLSLAVADKYADLPMGLAGIDEVVVYKRGRNLKNIGDFFATGLALKRRRFDLIVDFQSNYRSKLMAMLAAPRAYTFSFHQQPRGTLHRYSEALSVFGIPLPQSIPLGYEMSQDAARWAEDFIRTRGLSGKPLVGFVPAGLWAGKLWPLESYAELGRMLAREMGAQVLVFGSAFEKSRGDEIARLAGAESVTVTSGGTTFVQALALINRMALVVSNDSGLMQLAWLAGVPTIGLFGATDPAWVGPQGAHTAVFYRPGSECTGCYGDKCRFEEVRPSCIRSISAAEVFPKAKELIARGKAGSIRLDDVSAPLSVSPSASYRRG